MTVYLSLKTKVLERKEIREAVVSLKGCIDNIKTKLLELTEIREAVVSLKACIDNIF